MLDTQKRKRRKTMELKINMKDYRLFKNELRFFDLLNKQKERDQFAMKQFGIESYKGIANYSLLELDVKISDLARATSCFEWWRGGIIDDYDRDIIRRAYENALECFLSYAISKGWEQHMLLSDKVMQHLADSEISEDMCNQFLEIKYMMSKIVSNNNRDIAGMEERTFYFRMAWMSFLNLGMKRLGIKLIEMGLDE